MTAWEVRPIRDLADVFSGGGAPQDPEAFGASGHSFVRAASLPKLLAGAPERSLERITSESAVKYRLRLFPAETVVFAKSGMSALKGHIYRLRRPAYVVNHLAALVPHDPADGRYLERVLQFRAPTRLVQDAAYPSIRLPDIARMEVPVPPAAERRRIAEVLDRADALRAKRRAGIAQLEILKQSIFFEMFGDPLLNPKNWPMASLGELVSFKGGGTPRRANPEYFQGNICWATSKDMKGEYLDDTQEHITESAIEQSATNLVPAGTILIVVKSKVLMHSLPLLIARVPTCFGQDIKGLRVNEGWSIPYVAASIRSLKRLLLKRARGVNTEGLTLEHLRSLPIMSVPGHLQEAYDARCAAVDAMKDFQKSSIRSMDELIASASQGAFVGAL